MPDIEVKGLEGFPEALTQSLPEAMQPALRKLADHGKQAATGAARSSTISRSLMAEASATLGRVYSTLPPAQANVLESGRKPGRKGPPLQVIQDWAARKGIHAGGFILARAIARRGIPGRFFMKAGRQAVEAMIPQVLGEAAARYVARVKFNSEKTT